MMPYSLHGSIRYSQYIKKVRGEAYSLAIMLTMFSSLSAFETICCFCALLLLRRFATTKSQVPLPPGPKGLPLIGNLFDIPRAYEWLTFSEWAKRWGKLFTYFVKYLDLIE